MKNFHQEGGEFYKSICIVTIPRPSTTRVPEPSDPTSQSASDLYLYIIYTSSSMEFEFSTPHGKDLMEHILLLGEFPQWRLTSHDEPSLGVSPLSCTPKKKVDISIHLV